MLNWQLAEWIASSGSVSPETAAVASEECEKLLRMGDRAGRPGYDRKKLLLYAIISGSRRQVERLLRDVPSLFGTIEDFLWFKLSAIHDCPGGSSSIVLSEGLVPYNLDDLQGYLNKFEPSYYTKNGKDPLVYPYVLLLSIQFLPAVLYLFKEVGEEGYTVDAVHISIALADNGVLSDGIGTDHKIGVMDACAEVASIIRQYGSVYLRQVDATLPMFVLIIDHNLQPCHFSTCSLQEKEPVSEQQTVLRQLEAILHISKLARAGQHVDALREIIKIPFLPLNPRVPDVHYDVFQKLSPHVQACVPDLLKIALNCLDNVKDSDGTLRALKSKVNILSMQIANLVANNMSRNWPQDLIEKVAQSI
ncbi:hypothetical protein GW17_00030885 [Ensete ventricosum]|nr:hypothetical protein GW17_00030885 [Ensete ventricosum]